MMYRTTVLQMLGQIRRDSMLRMALAAPFLAGALFRLGAPALETLLCRYFSRPTLLARYFPLMDAFLALLAPIMLCFAFAMVTLEEVDDKVAQSYLVTPLGKSGYLFTRMGVPALLSLPVTSLTLLLFHLGSLPPAMLAAFSIFGALTGLTVALMIVCLSTNKLEGMAVTKLASLFTLGLLPPWFLRDGTQYLFAALPTFWIAKTVKEGRIVYFFMALLVFTVWLAALCRRFSRKMER